jgi:hypothetical protein
MKSVGLFVSLRNLWLAGAPEWFQRDCFPRQRLEGAGITNGWRACDHVDSVQDA